MSPHHSVNTHVRIQHGMVAMYQAVRGAGLAAIDEKL